ncbi:MAG: hypothetical protein ABSH50_31980 [Bryobacteraceae bacterium]
MNVTGVEWRDLDAHDARVLPDRRRRRAPNPAGADEEEDVIQLHCEDSEEPADGLDVVGDGSSLP